MLELHAWKTSRRSFEFVGQPEAVLNSRNIYYSRRWLWVKSIGVGERLDLLWNLVKQYQRGPSECLRETLFRIFILELGVNIVK